jgi:hypothetical protein
VQAQQLQHQHRQLHQPPIVASPQLQPQWTMDTAMRWLCWSEEEEEREEEGLMQGEWLHRHLKERLNVR